MPELHHHADPLENLSLFEGRCRVCERNILESTVEERDTAWVDCPCGHNFEITNLWRWH
jgi:hypothetical protein